LLGGGKGRNPYLFIPEMSECDPWGIRPIPPSQTKRNLNLLAAYRWGDAPL
jgi:hypothetical protein